MIFLISCMLVCLDLFVACRIRIIDLGMWTADFFVTTFLQAEFWALVYNMFLLKNNEIGLYFWYSFVHFLLQI